MNYIRRVTGTQKDVVRVVRLAGQIRGGAAQGQGRPQHINIQNVEKQLSKAFDCKKQRPKAVALEINSPGGSAAQSNLVYTRIRNLAEKNKVPVISFAEDHALSGGYWLALAGDEIYADPNSMVGSIGALYAGMGMEELMKKLGNNTTKNVT